METPNDSRKTLVVIGALPPPVHGMSFVTGRMVEVLAEGFEVTVADITPGGLRRGAAYHARKIVGILRAIRTLAARAERGKATLYLPSDGGWGLLYTAGLVALARAMGYRIFLHHHNYSYLTRCWRSMRLVCWSGGPRTAHVLLCSRMQARFEQLYASARRTLVLSNAGFVEGGGTVERHADAVAVRIGHLGNLSLEKGIDLVVEVFERLLRAGVPARLVLGGPVVCHRATRLVAEARSAHGTAIEYRGAVEPHAKGDFFGGIDVFLFPSRLAEAEPLVVLEALAFGVPVIAGARGCLPGLLGQGAGVSVAPGDDFVEVAVRHIERWSTDRGSWKETSRRAASRFDVLRRRAVTQLAALVAAVEGRPDVWNGRRMDT